MKNKFLKYLKLVRKMYDKRRELFGKEIDEFEDRVNRRAIRDHYKKFKGH